MTEFQRTFGAELEVRAAGKGGDGRIIEGIAVPFARPMRITDRLVEQFRKGAMAHQIAEPHRVKLKRDHQAVIGRALELREDAAGLWGAWRVSPTSLGDETLALVQDGALTDLSVGFRARQDARLPDGTIERVKVDLREVSVVESGAYGDDARVVATRGELGDDEALARLAEAGRLLARLPIML